MTVDNRLFGKTADGRKVFAFTVTNTNGLEMTVITYGATLQSFIMPDKTGKRSELTLGFDTVSGYESSHPYYGATVGRVANRIKKGRFTLNGKDYILTHNNGIHHIHGGTEGFSRKIWDAYPFINGGTAGVKLFLESPDGEEGYPGKLNVSLTVSLDEDNTLVFQYHAVTDAPTIINLTNHAYWNLSGAGKGKIYDHILSVRSSAYLETDGDLIPTGRIISVENTPLDFTKPKPIGRDIDAAGGYDHCFVLDSSGSREQAVMEVFDPVSSRKMELYADSPGLQLYTGNFLKGQTDRTGALDSHDAVCFETEAFPDAVHHENFSPVILNPEEIYSPFTKMRFSLEKKFE